MIVVASNGSYWCSCALINNTNYDGKPYVLTANHCLKGFDAEYNPNASQWIFFWEYEDPGCTRTSSFEPIQRSTVGATVIANFSFSDFALLLLKQAPHNLNGVIPYFLGWDRSTAIPAGGVGIHHPMGDVKKISTYSQTPYLSADQWELNWINTPNGHSVTEGGSSGSPLLTSRHLVIGQLYGTDANNYTCSNPSKAPSYYGRFDVSWTGFDQGNRRLLKPWLDPKGSNPTSIPGKNCGQVISISGPSITRINSRPTYTAYPADLMGIYEWRVIPEGQGTKISASNSGTNTVVVEFGNNPGSYTVMCRMISDCTPLQMYTSISVSATISGIYTVSVSKSNIITITLNKNLSESSVKDKETSSALLSYSLRSLTTGILMAKGQIPTEGGEINLGDIATGVYTLSLDNGEEVETHKVLLH